MQAFKRQHFSRALTIGLQIRQLKCNKEAGSIHCDQLPAVEDYASVARSLQRARGLADEDVRFFVGADRLETYAKVGGRRCTSAPCSLLGRLHV